MKDALIRKIEAREARVGIIGLGYVGLPLLLEFANKGFPVLGLDIDNHKVQELKAGRSYIRHIPAEPIRNCFKPGGKADATADYSHAATCDALIVCVPTPLTHHRDPDLSFI